MEFFKCTNIISFYQDAMSTRDTNNILLRNTDKFILLNKFNGEYQVSREYDNNIYFDVDPLKNKIYIFIIQNNMLTISIFPENKEISFELSSNSEYIVSSTIGQSYLLIKTIKDTVKDDQISYSYLIDLDKYNIYLINDEIINSSYHIPYIVGYETQYIVIETSKFYPYELGLDEIKELPDFVFENDILFTELSSFVNNIKNKDIINWDVISTNTISKEYIQIVKAKNDSIFYVKVNIKDSITNLYKYTFSNNKNEALCTYPEIIDHIVFGDNDTYYGYLNNTEDEQLIIYDNQGLLLVNIEYSQVEHDFHVEYEDILIILKNRYVILSVSKDIDNDDNILSRVVYDITTKKYKYYPCSLIDYENRYLL